MSNSVVNHLRNSPAKKQRSYADVANSSRSSSTPSATNNLAFRPSFDHYLARLEFLLGSEMKFRGSAQPPTPSAGNAAAAAESGGNSNLSITSGMRDGSAHVLRCLKVWYDLPSEVFFWAVSSIDRFLTKMKAQPKHLSCIAVSAFHLACRHYRAAKEECSLSVPDPADLVTISQSRCTPSDLLRMQAILVSKLDLQLDDAEQQVRHFGQLNGHDFKRCPRHDLIFTFAAAGAAGGDFAVTAEDDVRHVQDRHRLHGAEGSAVG